MGCSQTSCQMPGQEVDHNGSILEEWLASEGVNFAQVCSRLRSFFRFCGRNDDEDLASEVLFRTAKSFRQRAPESGKVWPWLFAIARNVLSEERRKNEAFTPILDETTPDPSRSID